MRPLAPILCFAVVCALGCARPPAAPAEGGAPATTPDAAATPPALTGDYLGQPLPGSEPQLFAGGVVSTGLDERDVTMTPDGKELYFTAQVGGNGLFSAILVTRQVEGKWTPIEVAPFSGQYLDLEPAISPEGGKLFFVSNRPRPGSDQLSGSEDIWVMDREGDGWGEPHNLGPPVNTDQPEFFPSVTRDGTLYFTGRDADGGEAIFRSRPAAGGYATPQRLGPEVNSGQARFNAFVAPDESFVIVSVIGGKGSLGGPDYYVVFRSADDRFHEPIHLDDRINTPTGAEWSASLSPDGKVLFFMSSRSVIQDHVAPRRMSHDEIWRLHGLAMNGSSDIWWVDAGLIAALRPAG